VQKMCQVMKVSQSGYYKWLMRPASKQRQQRKLLTRRVFEVFIRSRKLYGSPKITACLRKDGIKVSQKTVARLMKANSLISRVVKKYKATTNSKHTLPTSENVLNQDFTATKPNQKWVSDITYVRTQEGWLYVASVMDLFSKKVVGWHADSTMTKEIVLTALRRAYFQQKPDSGIVNHSDRGVQYASYAYQDQLKEYGMISSMSRKGNCYDNACIESFHSLFKKECVFLNKFKTREVAKKIIFDYTNR